MRKGRIAVLMPAVRDTLDAKLLEGIYAQARRLDYDVLVFTNASNSLKEYPLTDYVCGEENIYRLVEIADVDGILFAAGRFRNDELINRILRRMENVSVPCLVLEYACEKLPSLFPPHGNSIHLITKHLIEAHGCRKLHCLTGYPDNPVSEECRDAFFAALQEAGIQAHSDQCTYGDFWKESARQLAERIVRKEIPFPDAVVCVNDAMALSLCDALKSHGIRVPENILITGNGGSLNASLHEPMLTTVAGMDEYLGALSVIRLLELTGKKSDTGRISVDMHIKHGTSCGCPLSRAAASHENSKVSYLERDYLYNCTYSEYYMTSNFIGQFADAQSLAAFSQITDSLSYLLPKWKHIDICLCEDWLGDFAAPDCHRTEGYPQRMRLILSRDRNKNAENGFLFSTRHLLPFLQTQHEPQFIVFTPLHFQNQVLGYSAVTFDQPKDFLMEERYHNWCDALASGLLSLKNKLYMDYMHDKIEQYSVRDPVTGMLNRKGLLQRLPAILDVAAQRQCAVQMLLLSWAQDTASASNHEEHSVLFANILQMTCKSEELAARLGEKMYAILIPVPAGAEASEELDQKLLQMVQFAKKTKKETAFTLPQLETESFRPVKSDSLEEQLEAAVKSLRDRLYQQTNEKHDYAALLSRLRIEMKMLPQSEWDAETAAAEIGISKSYFQRLYKQQFGIAFTEDLIMARLHKAKKLLKNTSLHIQEIAEQCGYENASHFMRQFKDRFGVTAAQYRKM